MMDLQPLLPWIAASLSVIALLTQAKSFFSSGEKALDNRLGKAEGTLIDHDRRVQKIENELEHLPSKEDVHELKLAIERLNGVVAKLGGDMQTISRTVDRIDNYLREDAKA